MATAKETARLLTMLAQQTKLGNVVWEPDGDPFSFTWQGNNASVALYSINEDGRFPVRLAVFDSEGEEVQGWTTEDEQTEKEGTWDYVVSDLWREITGYTDPIRSLVQDLERLPPF